MTTWNPYDLDKMALPPCHILFQCYITNNPNNPNNTDQKYLNGILYQRSADVGLGVPFNIASYSLLIMLLALETGLRPGKFIHFTADTHIYENHVEPLLRQMKRVPRSFPGIQINKKSLLSTGSEAYSMDDLKVFNYNPYDSIKMEMAI
jgi:thymidylate synthase